MAMWFISVEAQPSKSFANPENLGGAFVNAWVQSDTLQNARQITLKGIRDQQWDVISIEDEYESLREQCPEQSLEYYDQAVVDKLVMVWHTFPTDDPDINSLD